MSELRLQIDEAVSAIRRACSIEPAVALVLGTGLGSLVDRMKVECRLRMADVPHFATPTVNTHAGELLLGWLAGKPVLAVSGRVHVYEGYTMKQVTFPVRVAKALGAKVVVVSNAAGGLNPQFKAGDLMLITDHINLMGDNPLIGPNDDALGPRFPDMSEPYDKGLVNLADSIALSRKMRIQRGVYLAVPGPNLETAAEYRFMRMIGADAVGMSTVPEAIVAVHAGLRVLGFSAITDECLPDALQKADVDKIVATANAIEPQLTEVVAGCVENMEV
jgi:purine-nucleoside phosphorylase